jgi:hypothetical protein
VAGLSVPTLWTPPRILGLLRHRPRKRTVTLADGRRALITVDDSGTVQHTEYGDRLDVVVRPQTIRVQVRIGGKRRG